MLQPAANQTKFLDLTVDGGQLFSKRRQAAVNGITLHMLPYFFQGEPAFLHDQDGVQIVNLLGTVITIAVIRVHIGRLEQTDFIVKNQSLL